MYGYIYKTTCLANNKIYIGQKKSKTFLGQRYLGSGKILKNAIKYYGRSCFDVELLEECQTFDELNQCEIYYIAKYNSTNADIGYNITSGGQGVPGFDSKYHDGMKGKRQSDFQKEQARKANSRKRTPQECLNMSIGQTGKTIPSAMKKVRCIELNLEFKSVQDACKFAKSSHVGAVCRGIRKKAGGYT